MSLQNGYYCNYKIHSVIRHIDTPSIYNCLSPFNQEPSTYQNENEEGNIEMVCGNDNSEQFRYYKNQLYPVLSQHNYDEFQLLDDKIFKCIFAGDQQALEHHLTVFMQLFTTYSEKVQVYILSIYYTSIVTSTLRFRRIRKDLSVIYNVNGAALIRIIQNWRYSSEFFTGIPWLAENMVALMNDESIPLARRPHIKETLHLIDHHLNKNYLSVSWLSKQLEVSQPYLSMTFKEDIGKTLAHYIARKRVNTAALDLKYTSLSLTEITQKYGFRNKSHFTEVFKKYTGKTPTQYRLEFIG